jgi:gliding motility-associated lipoprotein GldD
MKNIFIAFILFISFLSCKKEQETFMPKPKGYHYISLPEHSYKQLEGDYPYTFQVSEQAVVEKDKHFLAQPSWIEIKYPQFGAEIDISYKVIGNNPDSLAGFIATSHKLSYKHRTNATRIDEYEASAGLDQKTHAMVFELEGEIPSPLHFYAHDIGNNFLRAALYLDTSHKNDSLQPIIEYLKVDMIHVMNTLEWKGKGK